MDFDLARRMIDLLPERVPRRAVEGYLRRQELTFSAGSWQELREKRLWPHLEDGEIGAAELTDLWRSGEQNLSFHCFLYKCKSSEMRAVLAPQALQRRMRKLASAVGLGQALPVFQPDEPQVADVRWDDYGPRRALVVKVEESRRYLRAGEERRVDGRLERNLEEVVFPAVDFLELHEDGLLVLRVEAHPHWFAGVPGGRASSRDYSRERTRLAEAVAVFLADLDPAPLWLVKAKSALWKNRKSLSAPLNFRRIEVRDQHGHTMEVKAGGEAADLAGNLATSQALDAFFARRGSCEELQGWWQGVAMTLPRREENEISIGRKWTNEAYGHILEGVLANN